ncbi:hypothetical protein AAGS40_29955 (plasmid) [Paraburkholderia sp. PREW-6R]|uniref:hypothetical protein n=1 Tax=Paraburkholderia sp. PREW-6R TaxID=3141544 RepID=UPI0031F499E0
MSTLCALALFMGITCLCFAELDSSVSGLAELMYVMGVFLYVQSVGRRKMLRSSGVEPEAGMVLLKAVAWPLATPVAVAFGLFRTLICLMQADDGSRD